MNSGSDLVETWIPDGGFEIQRRKVKTPEGDTAVMDCLTPKWSGDDPRRGDVSPILQPPQAAFSRFRLYAVTGG